MEMSDLKEGYPVVFAGDAGIWREWLENHSAHEKSIWLIIYHKKSGKPTVTYDEAVDEALCFGWVDSKPNKRDDESYFQFFSPRNPKSNWSKVNKDKVARLLKANKMAKAGLDMVAIAKANGSWNALDDVENLIIPEDLQNAFNRHEQASENWHAFPKSVKRGILEWIYNAKRPETRAKRVNETAEKASKNVRANQWR